LLLLWVPTHPLKRHPAAGLLPRLLVQDTAALMLLAVLLLLLLLPGAYGVHRTLPAVDHA
jgi:hypothetical protein